ncbi:TonB-dependent siderophore receptor [Sphingomonas lenta]|nr:TonB-dependent siderophore receptor [Sphingomonas lenta]
MNGTELRAGGALAMVLAAGLPAAALAQMDTVQAEGSSVETVETADGDVIVRAPNYVPEGGQSANKTDIPLIETPQSVSVVTRDQIDLFTFVDVQQAVRYTAGVFGENYGPDARYDFFTVRGFIPRQYVDGLPAPASSSIASVGVDLYGFQSLDLLKGPVSTLYGNAPPGGIYNLVSRRAESELGGELRAIAGTDSFYELAGTVTGPVADGWDARVTGLYRDRDLIADSTNTKRVYVAPTATWRLGADTTLTGLGYYQYDSGRGGNGGFLPVAGTLLPNPNGAISQRTNLADPRNRFTRRQGSGGFELTHRLAEGVRLVSNTRWNDYRERAPIGVYVTALAEDGRTGTQSNFTYAEDVRSFATDNRLDATFATGFVGHTLLVGVDYRTVDNEAAFTFGPAGTLDVFDPVYATPGEQLQPGYQSRFNDQRLKQTGIYAQEQLRLGPLSLILGGRYDWVRSDYLTPFLAVTAPAAETRVEQERFTYRLGATYVSADGIAPYVSYSTSFEPVLGSDAATGRAFEPTTGEQWEAGVKYDARSLSPDIRLFATAALFRITQDDVVQTSPSTGPVFGTQTGRVRIRGGEVELVARIREQLSINAAYSYNDPEILESNVAQEVGVELAVTPKHKASLFVNYNVQRGALAGLGLGLGGRYTSSSAGSLPGPFNPVVYRGEAATLVDAIVSYDVPGWRFSLNGSNILDERYVARATGPVGAFYGAPRQVLFAVTKRF